MKHTEQKILFLPLKVVNETIQFIEIGSQNTDCIPLQNCCVYIKYPLRQTGVWFNNLRRMTTNSFLRQIIPINYQDGLIMVSYTDGEDIRSFKDKKTNC